MKVLLAAGFGVAVLGLIAFVIGYPISDTSFGNAMMIDGVIVLCTGLLILALSVVNRQLERIAALLGDGQGLKDVLRPVMPVSLDPTGGPAAPLFPAAEIAEGGPSKPETSPSWVGDAAARTSVPPVALSPSEEAPPELPVAQPAPAERPRRNLLFESRRRDRSDPVVAPKLAEPDPLELNPDDGKPAEPKLFEPKPFGPAEPPKPSFDDAWSGSPAHAPRASEPDNQPDAAPSVTVIKSGTVDGMAYSLYSDGSIEAQMPQEGLIRFASLDALRDYLEEKQ